jgi:hypothetical protein
LIFKREANNDSAQQNLTKATKLAVNQGKMLIFPNPVSSNLQINLSSGNLPVELRIYNMNGKVVKRSTWNTAGTIVQSVSDLHLGDYVIELRKTTGNTVLGRSKFIKN